MRLANDFLVGGLVGLLLSIVIIGSRELGVRNQWIRLAVAMAAGWLLALVLLPVIGRWRVVAEGRPDSDEVRKWLRVRTVATWLGVAAMFGAAINLSLEARAIDRAIHTLPPAAALDRVDLYWWLMLFGSGIGVGAGLVALGIAVVAEVRKNRALAAEAEEPKP